jgi:hypothetical protein
MPHNKRRRMNYKFGLIIIVLTLSLSSKLTAQNSNKRDSLKVCIAVNDFFEWYIDAINQKKNSDFQPTFIESKNGMTTLNFNRYFNNLTKYGFSDSLLIKEKLSYQHCIDELKKVKYSDFNTKFTDLEDFENMQCDFGNYYRWIGGQEPIDGIRIKNVKFNSSFSVTVQIENFDYNPEEKKNIYWGSNLVTLKKIKHNWKIENINWK